MHVHVWAASLHTMTILDKIILQKMIQGGEICKSRVRDSLSNPSRDTFCSHQMFCLTSSLYTPIYTHTHMNHRELYNHSLLTEALKNSQDTTAACYNIMQPYIANKLPSSNQNGSSETSLMYEKTMFGNLHNIMFYTFSSESTSL